LDEFGTSWGEFVSEADVDVEAAFSGEAVHDSIYFHENNAQHEY